MPKARGRNVLKKYEVTNLLFFLVFVAALGLFVSWVFRWYRSPNPYNPRPVQVDNRGVLSEVISPSSGTCILYLGTELSKASLQYGSAQEIPATDDGLVRELFAIPGVMEVTVDRRILILKKIPAAHWEEITPAAREVVEKHLHRH